VPARAEEELRVPPYGCCCLSDLLAALVGSEGRAEGPGPVGAWWAPGGVFEPAAPWLRRALAGAAQTVLLVVDGLGWWQLRERSSLAGPLGEAEALPVSSVAPTTTATALTSLTTGLPPAGHGVLGYRLLLPGRGVLNVLRWQLAGRDVREEVPPELLQPRPAFRGRRVPVVSRAAFRGSGFSALHLRGARLVPWEAVEEIASQVGSLLSRGEPLVYAYYDGLDLAGHRGGLGAGYEEELRRVGSLVGALLARLPPGAALVVTADHGMVEAPRAVELGEGVERLVAHVSGEGRFRWLHARPGAQGALLRRARDRVGDLGRVVGRDRLIAAGVFGGTPSADALRYLGDVAVVAEAPVYFPDPADPGERALVGRHGGLTPEELLVPLAVLRR
jgi:hypothetical protein